MIEEVAVVALVEQGRIWVEPTVKTSCAGCAQKDACGTSLLEKLVRKRQIVVDTPLSLRPGDQVVVGLDESALIKGSLLLYLMPLLALFAGGAVGEHLFVRLGLADVQGGSALFAILGLLLSLLAIHRMQNSFLPHYLARPVVLRKL